MNSVHFFLLTIFEWTRSSESERENLEKLSVFESCSLSSVHFPLFTHLKIRYWYIKSNLNKTPSIWILFTYLSLLFFIEQYWAKVNRRTWQLFLSLLPGFTANLASFITVRLFGKYNIIFYMFNNIYPWFD